jgi:hypothetical protein
MGFYLVSGPVIQASLTASVLAHPKHKVTVYGLHGQVFHSLAEQWGALPASDIGGSLLGDKAAEAGHSPRTRRTVEYDQSADRGTADGHTKRFLGKKGRE